jgi:aspartyl-tRNA(Asn)/glutamyl-tRNA(Gln) amidotransferase subunit B
MRTKEGSSDYRYFTEPDLVPLVVTPAWREEIRATLPELPHQRKARYVELGIDPQSAGALSAADVGLRKLFEATVAVGADPRSAANWITGEVVAWMRREELEEIDVEAAAIAEMIGMIDANELSTSAAKDVLDGILRGEGSAREVAESRDLLQMTDTGAIESAVDAVLAENADAVERYRNGEQKVVGFLVGQVMRATQGKADPKAVNSLLKEKLS